MSKPSNQPGFNEILSGVLGPEGPELACDQCFEMLDRYLEREIDSGEGEVAVPGMTAHLAGCPACAEDYSSLRALVTG